MYNATNIHDFDQLLQKIQLKYRPLSANQNLFKSIIMNAFQKQAKNDKLQMDDLSDAIFCYYS